MASVAAMAAKRVGLRRKKRGGCARFRSRASGCFLIASRSGVLLVVERERRTNVRSSCEGVSHEKDLTLKLNGGEMGFLRFPHFLPDFGAISCQSRAPFQSLPSIPFACC